MDRRKESAWKKFVTDGGDTTPKQAPWTPFAPAEAGIVSRLIGQAFSRGKRQLTHVIQLSGKPPGHWLVGTKFGHGDA